MGQTAQKEGLPKGFVYIDDLIPDCIIEPRYYLEDNFMGVRADGYEKPFVVTTQEAADCMVKAADILRKQGYIVKFFDAYRPQRAVNHFMRWAEDPTDLKTQAKYYPEIDKSRSFELGYIAKRSGHSRGSAIDLTICDPKTGEDLDMGSGFDYMGDISHHGTPKITKEQEKNRNILRDAMVASGFKIYNEEWWHYSLENEPYPDTYFDFPIK